jgi:hypothetical protein
VLGPKELTVAIGTKEDCQKGIRFTGWERFSLNIDEQVFTELYLYAWIDHPDYHLDFENPPFGTNSSSCKDSLRFQRASPVPFIRIRRRPPALGLVRPILIQCLPSECIVKRGKPVESRRRVTKKASWSILVTGAVKCRYLGGFFTRE